ncbi:hypothetical protein TcCL_ESM11294 [Trypanosoma cruzi]|nr:hypothetical protein TcCL_ESM11294 [Trypanosoma cruzi]
MIMNRPLRKATRGRLLLLLRCTSGLYNSWAGLLCLSYFFEFHGFFPSPSTRTCTQSPCLPSCGRETGMQGKMWLVPACGKVFLVRDCDCDVRPDRQEWDERRAEGRVTTIVCGAMRSE